MAKRKKKEAGVYLADKQHFSFDTESIIFMAVLGQTIRTKLEQTAMEMSENKICIPVTTMRKAAKKLGLASWFAEMPAEPEPENGG